MAVAFVPVGPFAQATADPNQVLQSIAQAQSLAQKLQQAHKDPRLNTKNLDPDSIPDPQPLTTLGPSGWLDVNSAFGPGGPGGYSGASGADIPNYLSQILGAGLYNLSPNPWLRYAGLAYLLSQGTYPFMQMTIPFGPGKSDGPDFEMQVTPP